MSDKQIGVGVLGASGYIGAELLRYLAAHPEVDVRWATAHSNRGEKIAKVLPNLMGFYDGTFDSAEDAEARMGEVRCVFVALPHNQSQDVIPRLASAHPDIVFIDMAGDFRTNDPAGYLRYYKKEHAAPEVLGDFVYGFTEFQREALQGAKLIANPGCFATGMLVALAPLVKAGLIAGDVCVTGITGSSGSGNKPSGTTHHPERASNLRSYKPLAHQHLLEVESFLGGLGGESLRLQFVPQSGPFVRGIFSTIILPDQDESSVQAAYAAAYDKEPLISVTQGSPELRWIQGTPRTVIGIAAEPGRGVAVFSVIDNLGKGAAGQALQNFNQVFGLAPTAGLSWPGGFV